MNGLTINISWEYFLGIMGALILIAWYTNGRFTNLETSMEWIKKILSKLKLDITADELAPAKSPRQLNERGQEVLDKSGIKKMVEDKKAELLDLIKKEKTTNPYDTEQTIFHIMKSFLEHYPEKTDELKKGAFR